MRSTSFWEGCGYHKLYTLLMSHLIDLGSEFCPHLAKVMVVYVFKIGCWKCMGRDPRVLWSFKYSWLYQIFLSYSPMPVFLTTAASPFFATSKSDIHKELVVASRVNGVYVDRHSAHWFTNISSDSLIRECKQQYTRPRITKDRRRHLWAQKPSWSCSSNLNRVSNC